MRVSRGVAGETRNIMQNYYGRLEGGLVLNLYYARIVIKSVDGYEDSTARTNKFKFRNFNNLIT